MKYRDLASDSAIVLVHGFAGDKAWQPMIDQLLEHPNLTSWDIDSFQYVSSWMPRWLRYRLVWSPSLTNIADSFSTYCMSTLNRYKHLSLLGHSAGGLIIERALMDSEWLRNRVRHVALFGAPTGGVRAARRLAFLNPQLRDVAAESTFLRTLQADLSRQWKDPTFAWRIVAAVDDVTVLRESVFYDFPRAVRRTVPGDHVTMIQPTRQDEPVVGLVANLLCSPRLFLSYVREDEAIVKDVFATLVRHEFTPWIDQGKLVAGDVWDSKILEALRESDRFLVFLSAHAIAKLSGEGVFRHEVDTAVALQKERGAQSAFVVPVRLEDVPLPQDLASFQWYDLFTGSAEGLAKALEASTLKPE
ncbi:hypothetical protein WH5701_09339 [Synechococcus sp. WH 5701]|nr:hypothetical protein WH5701_09339 [Synechococcus sp. WH 5701]